MKKNKKILVIIGTRPEAIKMAPVISELLNSSIFDVKVFLSGQHNELIEPMLKIFDIKPSGQLVKNNYEGLNLFISKLIVEVDQLLRHEKPDLLLVHGDTSTAMSAAMTAFHLGIKVGHVEAGLRTHDLSAPFPEEFNRVLAGYCSEYHFAPTETAKDNLNSHGIIKNVFITGNTVVDSIKSVVNLVKKPENIIKIKEKLFLDLGFELDRQKFVLITGHRRENFGKSFEDICSAILRLASKYPDKLFIYPVHLNPNVQTPVNKILGNKKNIFLIPPQDYLNFVFLLNEAILVITDSGGIQEECPSIGTPLILMRDKTERPEVFQYEGFRLTGTSTEKIFKEAVELIENFSSAKSKNPFGDGNSAKKIVNILENQL